MVRDWKVRVQDEQLEVPDLADPKGSHLLVLSV